MFFKFQLLAHMFIQETATVFSKGFQHIYEWCLNPD